MSTWVSPTCSPPTEKMTSKKLIDSPLFKLPTTKLMPLYDTKNTLLPTFKLHARYLEEHDWDEDQLENFCKGMYLCQEELKKVMTAELEKECDILQRWFPTCTEYERLQYLTYYYRGYGPEMPFNIMAVFDFAPPSILDFQEASIHMANYYVQNYVNKISLV